MGRDDDVVEIPPRAVRWKRLGPPGIDRRAGDPVLLKGLEERPFVDDRSARDVHQPGRRFHRCDHLARDESASLIRERRRDREIVGFATDLGQAVRRDESLDAVILPRAAPDADDAHAQCARQACELGADAPHPDDHQHGVPELDVLRRRAFAPAMRALIAEMIGQAFRCGEHHRHHELGDRHVV